MGQSSDELKQDLYSRDPGRVQAAIRNLRSRLRTGEEIDLPRFGVEILDAFGDRVPEQTQTDFITLIRRYQSFIPQFSDQERLALLVALVLRYGDSHTAFEVALAMHLFPDASEATRTAINEIVRQGLNTPVSIQGAKELVSDLLDDKRLRKAALDALRMWPSNPSFQEVVEYVAPGLGQDDTPDTLDQ
jgi:hypothetical protein